MHKRWLIYLSLFPLFSIIRGIKYPYTSKIKPIPVNSGYLFLLVDYHKLIPLFKSNF